MSTTRTVTSSSVTSVRTNNDGSKVVLLQVTYSGGGTETHELVPQKSTTP